MKRILLLTLLLWAGQHAILAQQKLTGKVTDGDGEPLPGATVRLKHYGMATTTAATGEFSLPVPPASDTLVISLIGYHENMLPLHPGQTMALKITLDAKINVLGKAIVSTGFYQIPQERATGSFTHVDNKLLNRSTGTNILDRLEGVTGSLQFDRRNISEENTFGHRPGLRIRGVATIESETSPLIIVDNFPYESDISTINPNDIESITILKDAAAASIWGARAGNGVIVVTTKDGHYNQDLTISLTSNTTIGERPDLYYNPNFLPSDIVMGFEKELFDRGFYEEDPRTPIPAYVELLMRKRDGLITENEFSSKETLMRQTDVRDEALDHLYQPSIDQQYALNLRGGGKSYRYYLSAGYDRNRSFVVGNSYSRLNLGLQNSFRPITNLELTAAVWYTQQHQVNNGLTLSELSIFGLGQASPYTRLANDSGKPLPVVRQWRLAYTGKAIENGLLDWQFRPLDEIRLANNTNGNNEIRLNGQVRYRFRDLRLQATYQYIHNYGSSENYYAPETYYARNLANQFTQEDGTQVIPYGGILVGGPRSKTLSHSGRLQLNYKKSLGDHEIAMLAGGGIRQQVNNISPGHQIFEYDKDILTGTARFDYTSIYPVLPSGYAYITQPSTYVSQLTDRFVSYFGNASYSYKRKYIFSGSLRWDASNLFGVRANQRGVPLWSLGISWDISGEPFYQVDKFPFLRFRLTYGSSGNVNKSVTAFPVIRYGTDSNTDLPYSSLRSAGNPDLRWEQVKTVNAGIDFRTLDNQIMGSIEYYAKNATDLIGIDYMDPTSGIIEDSRLENRINYADMRTQGVDLSINARIIRGTFNWDAIGLFTYVSNKITNYNREDLSSVSQYLSDDDVPMIIGESRDIMYAFPWHGLDHQTGIPVVYLNGEQTTDYTSYWRNYNPESLVVSGVSVAPYFGSLRNSFSFKNLTLSALITWKAGYVFRRTSMAPGAEYAEYQSHHRDYFKRWQKPGDELYTDVPAYNETYDRYQGLAFSQSEALITSGDHIRLQDVSVSYAIPCRQLNIPLQRIVIQAYAHNLGLLWRANKNDLDPGYSAANYPPPTTMSLGLHVQF